MKLACIVENLAGLLILRRRERKHQRTLFLHCRFQCNPSNSRHTTGATDRPSEKDGRTISGECELYPGISDHFPAPYVKSSLGGTMTWLLDVVMTTLTWFLTLGMSPQPHLDQKETRLLEHVT